MRVHQLHPNRTTLSVWFPHYFTFEPRGWLKGFQRLAFWFLRKTHGLENYIGSDEIITYYEFDDKKFDNLIANYFQDRIELLSFNNDRPKELIIGQKEFESLVGTKGITQYFEFDSQRFIGMRVKVVPWMTGSVMI